MFSYISANTFVVVLYLWPIIDLSSHAYNWDITADVEDGQKFENQDRNFVQRSNSQTNEFFKWNERPFIRWLEISSCKEKAWSLWRPRGGGVENIWHLDKVKIFVMWARVFFLQLVT
jgi:hypothetical protein